METTALIIGYSILTLLALAIVAFAVALAWIAIAEARGIVYARKWRKRKLSQMKYETGRDCANYLLQWNLPEDTTIFEASNYFYNKLREKEKGSTLL